MIIGNIFIFAGGAYLLYDVSEGGSAEILRLGARGIYPCVPVEADGDNDAAGDDAY